MTIHPPPLTLAEIRERPTVSVPEAAAVLGISTQSAYRMVRDGRLPVVHQLGRTRRVQSAALLHLLGADPDPAEAAE